MHPSHIWKLDSLIILPGAGSEVLDNTGPLLEHLLDLGDGRLQLVHG